MLRRIPEQRIQRMNRHKLPERTDKTHSKIPILTLLLIIFALNFINLTNTTAKYEMDYRISALANRVLDHGIGMELRDEARLLSNSIKTDDKFSAEILLLMADGQLPTNTQKNKIKEYTHSDKLLRAIEKSAKSI